VFWSLGVPQNSTGEKVEEQEMELGWERGWDRRVNEGNTREKGGSSGREELFISSLCSPKGKRGEFRCEGGFV